MSNPTFFKSEKSFLILTFIYTLFNMIIFASAANIVFVCCIFLLPLVWVINIIVTIFILFGLYSFKKSKCVNEVAKKKLIKYNFLALMLTNVYSFIGISLGNTLVLFSLILDMNNELHTIFEPHLIFSPEYGVVVMSIITAVLLIAVIVLFVLEMIYLKKNSIIIEKTEEYVLEKKNNKKTSLKLFLFYIVDYLSIILMNSDTSFVIYYLLNPRNERVSNPLLLIFFTIIPDLIILLLYVFKLIVLLKNKELFKMKDFLLALIPFIVLILLKGTLNYVSCATNSYMFTSSLFFINYGVGLVSTNQLLWPFFTITYGVFLTYNMYKTAKQL
ncbi:MAG: hypothetical protein ACI31G_03620 [Bacilli bacterium]